MILFSLDLLGMRFKSLFEAIQFICGSLQYSGFCSVWFEKDSKFGVKNMATNKCMITVHGIYT